MKTNTTNTPANSKSSTRKARTKKCSAYALRIEEAKQLLKRKINPEAAYGNIRLPLLTIIAFFGQSLLRSNWDIISVLKGMGRLLHIAEDLKAEKLPELNYRICHDWLEYRAPQIMTYRTQYQYAQTLGTFGSWGERVGLLAINLYDTWWHTQNDGRTNVIYRSMLPEEVNQLLLAARYRPLIGRCAMIDGTIETAPGEALSFRNLAQCQMIAANFLREEVVRQLTFQGLKQALIYRLRVLFGLDNRDLCWLRIADIHFDSSTISLRTRVPSRVRPNVAAFGEELGDELRTYLALRETIALKDADSDEPRLFESTGELQEDFWHDASFAGLNKCTTDYRHLDSVSLNLTWAINNHHIESDQPALSVLGLSIDPEAPANIQAAQKLAIELHNWIAATKKRQFSRNAIIKDFTSHAQSEGGNWNLAFQMLIDSGYIELFRDRGTTYRPVLWYRIPLKSVADKTRASASPLRRHRHQPEMLSAGLQRV